MKVFMNSKGQYLQWREKQTRASPVLVYEWVDKIELASCALFVPNNSRPKWMQGDNPHGQIVVSLDVEVITTRTVTVLGS